MRIYRVFQPLAEIFVYFTLVEQTDKVSKAFLKVQLGMPDIDYIKLGLSYVNDFNYCSLKTQKVQYLNKIHLEYGKFSLVNMEHTEPGLRGNIFLVHEC